MARAPYMNRLPRCAESFVAAGYVRHTLAKQRGTPARNTAGFRRIRAQRLDIFAVVERARLRSRAARSG